MRLSETELERYREDGFALLRGVIPKEVLSSSHRFIEPWVEAHVRTWQREGAIDDDFGDRDLWHRFLDAWRAAGEPNFRRLPNHYLITPAMYGFMRSPVLLGLAEELIGTSELTAHGIFNARPQLPRNEMTQTPWHQDSQYWSLDYGESTEGERARTTHVVTMWIPLQPVDARSGTLQVISRHETRDRLFDHERYDYERTGFLRMRAAEVATLAVTSPELVPGDVLVFDHRTPHGAAPHVLDRIRWSIDVRYEATATATVVGRKYGFVAQSRHDPSSETPLEDWLKKQAPAEAFIPWAVPQPA